MTDQSSPITPPFELINQWHKEACKDPYNGGAFIESKVLKYITTAAAQWGWDQRGTINEAQLQERADQELEACCEWLFLNGYGEAVSRLRATRRPKPPSEADQALGVLAGLEKRCDLQCNLNTIRCALERLKKLEESTND
jgi:hypothetical protein